MLSFQPRHDVHGFFSPPSSLTQAQLDLIQRPLDAKIFLEGPWGCGKSTVGVERLLHLMASDVPADEILLLAPQRTLTWPYRQAMQTPGVVAGGTVSILTIGGLAQRMVELFWPLIAASAGFAHPDRPPTFLTLETAQYSMAYAVRPLLDEGYFSSANLDHNRIYSQILDNLNKAALVGFDHTEIEQRLSVIQVSEPGQKRIFSDAQRCATRFRDHCLAHNLLDFSLQLETFWRHVWPLPACQNYLRRRYRHIIVDNLEEDTPVTHDLLSNWLPDFTSALLIFDWEAGYRSFLGADPDSGYRLKETCAQQVELQHSFVISPEVQVLRDSLAQALKPKAAERQAGVQSAAGSNGSRSNGSHPFEQTLGFEYHRYYLGMLDWVTEEIQTLIEREHIAPSEISVLTPFLPDTSLYSMTDRFQQAGIPVKSHRPSRSLRDEPITGCLLTLAQLAHPHWGEPPSAFEVTQMLVQTIAGMDWVRANILSQMVYRRNKGEWAGQLSPFQGGKNVRLVERITHRYLQRYENLRQWLETYPHHPGESLDHFWQRLFGEVLSQKGYAFHENIQAAETTANLIESARKFRHMAGRPLEEDGREIGLEYIQMVKDGVIAAQYLRSWRTPQEEAVLIAPAHTFLMSNHPVRVQFWLNINSPGWYERLYQPLTNPYVLSRQWPRERMWTDRDEEALRQQLLATLSLGLLGRCTDRLYIGWSDLNEQGREERGRLLLAFQRMIKHAAG